MQGTVGPPSSQLHRIPRAATPAYLRRRAAGPKLRTTTKPCAAASSNPITPTQSMEAIENNSGRKYGELHRVRVQGRCPGLLAPHRRLQDRG
jgi:hypothetical protein